MNTLLGVSSSHPWWMVSFCMALCFHFWTVLPVVAATVDSVTPHPVAPIIEQDHRYHVNPDHIVSFSKDDENKGSNTNNMNDDLFRGRFCIDLRDECPQWKEAGKCETDADYTQIHCPRSCNTCDLLQRKVPISEWNSTLSSGRLVPKRSRARGTEVIHSVVGGDLGVAQRCGERLQEVQTHVQRQRIYFQIKVMHDKRFESVRESCQNYDPYCTQWALNGECDNNPEFMRLQSCPLACFSCNELDIRARCPMNPNAKNALYPGDLNAMFEQRILQNFNETYNITVLSRSPWVLTLDGFFTQQEADRLVELGQRTGYTRSTEVSHTGEDYASERRTSKTAWCNHYDCYEDPVVVSIFERMQELTGINMDNAESLQLLQYQVGGFYKEHNDFIDHELERVQGVRILTIFLYLNQDGDPPLVGGGTRFPKLDLTVEPKVGRAVIWPSVLNHDPHKVDFRTNHEALEVTQGVKYGANAWIHQRAIQPGC